MRYLLVAMLLFACAPAPSHTVRLEIAGQSMTEAEYVAAERARIERNGAGLVCGPGLASADDMFKGAADWPRARELLVGLCKEYGEH